VFSAWSLPRRYLEDNLGRTRQLVAGSQFGTGLEHGSRGIAIVESSYQATISESRLRRELEVICSVGISDSVIVSCSYDL
jgi:hypothetical protein